MNEHSPLPSPSKRLTESEINNFNKQNSPSKTIKSSEIKVLNGSNFFSNVEIRSNLNVKKINESRIYKMIKRKYYLNQKYNFSTPKEITR